MTPPLVCITWMDACAEEALAQMTQQVAALTVKLIEMQDVGYLLDPTEDRLVIAGEKCGDGDYRHVRAIPKVNVKCVEILKASHKTRRYHG